MKTKLFSYNQLDTFVHRLSGCTKLVCFLIMTTAVMLTYDFRVILAITVFSIIMVIVAKLSIKKIAPLLAYVAFFLVFNFFFTFFLAPYMGCDIYGSRTVLFHLFGPYDVTIEEMLYLGTKTLKYFSAIPLGFIFFLTTNPSELSSSLNNIKVPYKACTALSLTLRYIPDVQEDFTDIMNAQQARGLDNSKKTTLKKRIVNTTKVIIPLMLSTMDRIDSITNAMELRGYGKNKKRTWYSFRSLKVRDYLSIIFCIIVLCISLYMRFFVVRSLYYNPFV